MFRCMRVCMCVCGVYACVYLYRISLVSHIIIFATLFFLFIDLVIIPSCFFLSSVQHCLLARSFGIFDNDNDNYNNIFIFIRARKYTQDKFSKWMTHMPMQNHCRDELDTRNKETKGILKNESFVINHYLGRYVLFFLENEKKNLLTL